MKKYKKILAIAMTAVLSAALMTGCGTQTEGGEAEQAAEQTEGTAVAAEQAVNLVADLPTTQAFSQDAVDEDDIQTILTAGINAPSAMNKQPWHFSVVTDPAVLQKIADGMSAGMPAGGPPTGMSAAGNTPPAGAPDAGGPPAGADAGSTPPAVPGGSGAKAGIADAPLAIIISCQEGQGFDAGLACQAMAVEAQLLGYGTKIISSPTIALNGADQASYRELLGIPEDQSAVAVLLVGREDVSVDASTGATERNALEDMVSFASP